MAYVVVGYDEDGNPIWEDDGSEAGEDTETETPGQLKFLGGPEDIIEQSVGRFTIGSDVVYRLADGSGMGINTETGEYYPINAAQLTAMSSGTGSPSPEFMSNLRGAGVSLGASNPFSRVVNQLKSAFTKDGKTDWAALATAAAGVYAMRGGSDIKTGGYNKPVPKMTATREALDIQDPNRRPGQGGLRYFTDVQYTPQGDAEALAAAQEAAATQATGLRAAYTPAAAPAPNPYAGMFKMPWEKATTTTPAPATQKAASDVINELNPEQRMPTQQQQGTATMADGGIAMLARGGRYLSGATDGMADELRTSIDGKQPAALSHGEFVIPADVVSHLGNGNSEAGAKKLYDMMDRVRKARTGNEKQGKKINPDKFMPGGLAGYAAGGEVKHFQTGGTTGTGTGGTTPGVIGYGTSQASTLSPWVGEYVTNILGEAESLTKQPYQAYKGPLTAGESDLQKQAFAGASELAKTGYTPGTFTTGTFGLDAAKQYMNPYLQAVLDPTLAEMRRQSDITRLQDASRLTQAGAFGGSRQAIMEAEGRRNLLEKQRQAVGEGYASAYDKAMAQFNTEQTRQMDAQKAEEASRQYSADFGAKSLADLAKLGSEQRDIEQQGLTAERKAFEEERAYPFSMLDYRRKMLENLPIGASTSTPNTTGLSQITSRLNDLESLYDRLKNLGQAPG